MSKVKDIGQPKVYDRSGYKINEVHKHYLYFREALIKETGHLSNPHLKINNANYQAVIKLGRPVLGFLFEDLYSYKIDWLEAITEILGVDPVKKEHYGKMELMVKDWKEWQLQNKNLL